MSNTAKPLVTDIELFAAALLRRRILVVQRTNNVILLYPGIIEKYDEDTVCVSGSCYKRSECSFQIA
ncbi:hypothetical protein [Gorillibacterium massiliense]|uniref:hypothetical protein n=1 Tax=Gorillibacterium massiliense TaxID=1280390 RepID=UPI0004B95712|nr:hypothetical protein [Gorillibacterium massiliense]